MLGSPRVTARPFKLLIGALVALTAMWLGASSATALRVQDYPDVFKPATAQKPLTLTSTAQTAINNGTVLQGDVQTSSLVKEAKGASRFKGVLTRGKFLPSLTRAAGAAGLATSLYFEICRSDSIKCLLFDSDPALAEPPTSWKLSPNYVEFMRINNQDGIKHWDARGANQAGQNVDATSDAGFEPAVGAGTGGAAFWAGTPDCVPDCYPRELQGLGPLQYAVTFWGGGWDWKLWWLPAHGPSSVPGFESITRANHADVQSEDPLRLTYRPVISTTTITVNNKDNPSIPNAPAGVTIPEAPDWPDRTADLLTQPENLEALDFLQRRLEETKTAQALQQLNPKAADKPSADEARKIARACLATVQAAGISTNRCRERNLPIFVTANNWRGISTKESTKHDIEALSTVDTQNTPPRSPHSPLLNFEKSTTKQSIQGSRDWYANDPVCTDSSRPAKTDCDEFPFYSTEQGGKYASLRPPGLAPHLKVVPSADNQRQGLALQTEVYDKCGMRSGTTTPTANAVGGDPFLVIPVPEAVGLNTRGFCNGKTPAP